MIGLRIGVLGASRIAELAIVCPAATLGHLVAVAARDRGRAETFARSYGVERVVPTPTWSPTPRLTSSTTRWPTRFMRRGIWPPSRPVRRY